MFRLIQQTVVELRKRIDLRQHDNSFFGDPLLFRLASGLSAPILPELAELGAYAASEEVENRARLVNRHRPLLHLYDNHGTRCEEIDFHPAYHSLLTRARHAGIASSLFEENSEESPVRHQARAMRLLLLSGVEWATLQELCLASAALDLIHIDKALCTEWKPLLVSHIHDPLPKPYPSKQSAVLSFAIDDVDGAQTACQALPLSDPMADTGQDSSLLVQLYGLKNAVVNPLADGFLVRARLQGQPSLFLVPRLLANGGLNGISLSSAYSAAYSCADLHFHASAGWRLGAIGAADILAHRAQIHIQYDSYIMRVGMMRRALRLAVDRMRHDETQGQNSEITALQARILADAALDCAAATLLVLHLGHARDQARNNRQESTWVQWAAPLIGAWIIPLSLQILEASDAATLIANHRALNHHEGNFVARMRQALKQNCCFEKTPLKLLLDAVALMREHHTTIAAILTDLEPDPHQRKLLPLAMQMMQEDSALAGFFAEQFSYSLAASLMRPLDMDIVRSAFMASRLDGKWRSSYGMLDRRFNPTFILETLYPSA